MMALQLIPIHSQSPVVELDALEAPIRMGRSEDAEICLPDRWLSRFHCELVADGNTLRVRDLNSKHGTFVNGRAVQDATLSEGDELTIGLQVFVARLASDPVQSSS